MTAPRSLGVFSALLFAPSAMAGDIGATQSAAPPAASGIKLTYVVGEGEMGPEVRVYAQNTSNKTVSVDDNPHISDVKLYTAAGKVTELGPAWDYDMMSRAGPRQRWMTMKPGEKMLVGTSFLSLPDGATLEIGSLVFAVQVVTPEGTITHRGAAPVNTPNS